MLSPNAVTEAIAIAGAQGFSERTTLNAYPNSFLDTLTGLTKNAMAFTDVAVAAANGQPWACGVDALEEFAREGGRDSTAHQHTVLIDDQIQAVVAVAQRNIRLARTDAVPLINAVMKDLNQLINPDIPYAYSRMEVVQVQFHSLWSSEWVQNIARDFQNAHSTPPTQVGIVLSVEEEQYKNYPEFTKTGLSAVDNQLKSLLNSYTTDELDKLFNSAFYAGMLPAPSENNGLRFEDLLVTYVWAQNLLENPPERSQLSGGAYSEAISNVIARLGFRIWEVVNKRRLFASSGRLVLSYDGDRRVLVNDDLYADWLKAGNKPEMIMGAAVSGMSPRPVTIEDLSKLGERSLTEWRSYVAKTSARDQENKYYQSRGEFFKIIQRAIQERSAAEYLDSPTLALSRLEGYMGQLPVDFIKDPYSYVRDIVIGVFYPESDILDFLKAMDDCCAKDADLSGDDAAVLATIDYLTSWVAKFILRGRI